MVGSRPYLALRPVATTPAQGSSTWQGTAENTTAMTHVVENQVDGTAKKLTKWVSKKTSATAPTVLFPNTEHKHTEVPAISDYQTILLENKHLRNTVATLLEENNRLLVLRRKYEFPFLRLPAELRNEIYKYVLKVGEWRSDSKRLRRWSSGRHVQPLALLSVCKQIHAEASLLPYALNCLHFGYVSGFRLDNVNGVNTLLSARPPTPALSFLQSRNPAQLGMIQTIRIDYHTAIMNHAHQGALRFLEILPDVRKIRLSMHGNIAILHIKKHEFRIYAYSKNPYTSLFFQQLLETMIRTWKSDAEISIEEKQSLGELGWET